MRISLNTENKGIRCFGEMIKIRGKEIKDECELCGELTVCPLFMDGHGFNGERKRISDMVRCQRDHKEKRMRKNAETNSTGL